MNQNRLRSVVVWGAVIAQALSILLALGVIDVGVSDQINQVTAAVLQLLVLFGVLNNPTNPEGF